MPSAAPPASTATAAPSAAAATAPNVPPPVVAPAPPSERPLPPAAPVTPPPATDPLVELTGYVQAEYQSHADSQEQLLQGSSTTLNQNRFLIRRARLVAKRYWDFTSLEVELDGNTRNGPSFGLYRAEGSLFYRGNNDKSKAPLLQFTLGMFRQPFGYELPLPGSVPWFMERSQVSRALFPSEIDVGGRLSGEAGPFHYAATVTNGEPLGENNGFALQDPNKNKDFTLNVGAQGNPLETLTVSGGISANKGRGFHAGTPATKGVVTWTDLDENGIVSPSELVGTAPQAATRSQTFERWAVGADLELQLQTQLGTSMLYAEVITAKNLDRGFFPADPISNRSDLREFGYYIGFLQELTPYGIVGFRADFYDPNADATDHRAGQVLPARNTVRTYSPLVGLTLPKRARLVFQYDVIKDYLARDQRGVPTNLSNDAWTLRLQVSL